MAINTGGHQVSVMPNYTAVDANLAAFNPAAAMTGANQAIDMTKGLEELKNMRQIHEENAKMSAAKNKLLDAQAKQQDILSRAMEATTASEINRKNVENKSAADVTAAKTPVDIKAIEQRAFELGTQEAMNALARKHAVDIQPTALGTDMINAMIGRDTALANKARLSTMTSIADYGADAALVAARGSASRANQDQGIQKMISDLKFGDLASQIDAGQSTEARNAIATLAATEAGTKLKLAEAAKLAAESTPEYIAEKRKIAQTNDLVRQHTAMESLVNSTGRTKVLDPDGTPIELGQLFDAYYDFRPDGVAIPKNQDSLFRATANLTPNQKLDLERYTGLKMRARMLGKRVDEAYGAPVEQPSAKVKLRWDATTGTMVEVK